MSLRRGSRLALLVAMSALAACTASPTTARTSPTASRTVPGQSGTATSAPGQLVSWKTVTTVPAHTASIAFSAASATTAYLCAINGPAAAPLESTPRLYASADGGNSWTLLSAAPALHPVPDNGIIPLAECSVFVDAADARDVFFQQIELDPQGAGVAIARALARSRDGGHTWTPLGTIDRTDGFTALYVVGARLIGRFRPSVYGAASCDPSTAPKPTPSSQIAASDDGGLTWHDTGTGIESQGYTPWEVAAAGSTVFATAFQVPSQPCVGIAHSALWRSVDGGQTWSQVTTLGAAALSELSFTPRSGGGGFYGAMIDQPDVSQQTAVVLYSADSGAIWTALPAWPLGPEGTSMPLPLSDGDVLMGAGNATITARIRPSDAHPAWAPYATGKSEMWQITSVNGSTVWAVSPNFGNQSVVQTLDVGP